MAKFYSIKDSVYIVSKTCHVLGNSRRASNSTMKRSNKYILSMKELQLKLKMKLKHHCLTTVEFTFDYKC